MQQLFKIILIVLSVTISITAHTKNDEKGYCKLSYNLHDYELHEINGGTHTLNCSDSEEDFTSFNKEMNKACRFIEIKGNSAITHFMNTWKYQDLTIYNQGKNFFVSRGCG
jgi:hypothetical protein